MTGELMVLRMGTQTSAPGTGILMGIIISVGVTDTATGILIRDLGMATSMEILTMAT
jgi:hypothetical protein